MKKHHRLLKQTNVKQDSLPDHEQDLIRFWSHDTSGRGFDFSPIFRRQLEGEVLQQVCQEATELHLGHVLSRPLQLADPEGDETFTLGNEVTLSIEKVFRAKVIRVFPILGVVMSVMEVWEDEGALRDDEVVNLDVLTRAVHDADGVNVEESDQVVDEGLNVVQGRPVEHFDASVFVSQDIVNLLLGLPLDS